MTRFSLLLPSPYKGVLLLPPLAERGLLLPPLPGEGWGGGSS